MDQNQINPITGKSNAQVLAESTAAAQKAAAMIGTTFTPSPAVQQTITSANLAPSTGLADQVNSPVTSAPVAPPVEPAKTAPLEPTPEETRAQTLSEQTQQLIQQTLGKTAFTQEQQQATGYNEAQKTLNDLYAQIKGLQYEAQSIPLQFQEYAPTSGIAQVFVDKKKEDALRQNAIKTLSPRSMPPHRGNWRTRRT